MTGRAQIFRRIKGNFRERLGLMSVFDYVIDSALVLMVLLQIREQPLTRRRMIRPLLVVGAAVALYLRQVPTSGNDVWLTLVLAAVGAAIGWASGVTVHMRSGSDGKTLVQAGWASAVFWVLGMGGRFAFLVWVNHGGAAWVIRFSYHHDITSIAAWTVAVLAEVVFEVVARTAVMAVRGQKVGQAIRTGPEGLAK